MPLTTTHRSQPMGTMLQRGFRTLFAFALNPSVSIWERATTPLGWDGGEAIDISTFFNARYHTMAARSLITITPTTFQGGFDPQLWNQVTALCNQNGSTTQHFPDGSYVNFFGYQQKGAFQEMSEAGMPICTFTVQPTNIDPATGAETAPVYGTGGGTGT